MHGHCDFHGGRWSIGRHRRGRFGGPGFGGFGGRHGMGGADGMDPEDLRAGRMLAQGDLRLIALALIAEAPRHGYEIIKLVEEKTADWYSPSPGIVYPTLTYLEEAGHVTAASEGAKKLYAITEEGRAYLAEHRDLADAVLGRLAAVGERVSRFRRHFAEEHGTSRDDLPRAISGAIEDLREAARETLKGDRQSVARIVEAIERATSELRS